MTALAPYHPGAIGDRRGGARNGAVDVVQFAAGGVAADVRVERVDRRNRCSWYALRLASQECDVTGRLIGVRARGEIDELGCVAVTPGSAGSARFAVTAPRRGAYRAMFLEIRSDELLLRVEAPRPPAPRSFRALQAGAVLFAIGVAVSGAASLARAPGILHTGTATGAASHAAAIPVARPHAVAPAAAVARVLSFSARRDSGPGADTVLASYLAVADRGTIALLDAAETVVASSRFSRVGTVRLPVPSVYRKLPLTARITVHRGATNAVASVAVPPNPLTATASPGPVQPSAPDSAESSSRDAATPAGSTSRAGAGGMLSVDGRAVAGRPLNLRLSAQSSAMHVELQDETGATLADTDIGPGATRAVIPVPAAATPTTYLLALHYTRNGGEETVIRTVVAAPR
jgi:hypothetical protein